jgi:cytidylate kinase
MNALQKLESYLAVAAPRTATLRPAHLTRGIHPFVTISRETGAGGHSLAEKLLRKMKAVERIPMLEDWHVMDQELCQKILENPHLKVSLDALLTEELHSAVEDIVNGLIGGYTPQSQVMIEIFNTIRTVATLGKVIIVGRGAVCLTRALPYGIHVRLVAPRSTRIRRMMEFLNLSRRDAEELVARMDNSRARLLKTYFNKDIGDPLLYDVTWNTDSVSLEEISSSIIELIQSRAERAVAVA